MLAHLVEVSIRSLLLALSAMAVLRILRRRRTAALQHAVLAAVVCGMLALFAFGSVLPSLSLPVMPPGPEISMPRIRPTPVTTPQIMEEVRTPAPIPAKPHRSIDWSELVFYAYATIAFAFLVRFLTGLFLVRRLVAKSIPEAGFRESRHIVVPSTVGWFRPQILLPLEWRKWDQEKLAAVLAHEGSHARRRDGLIAALAAINKCVFWFHPLAWWLEQRLGIFAELACDDACVVTIGNREHYVQLLLDMARVVETSHGRLGQHALTMAATSHLHQRVDSILKEGRTFSRGLRWTAWGAIAACGIPIILGAGTVRLERQIPLLPPRPLGWPPVAAPPPPPPPRWLLAQARSTSVAPRSTARVRFEVASIRPAGPGAQPSPPQGNAPPPPPPGATGCMPRASIDPGRVGRACVSLKELLLMDVFGIPQGRLAGPDWLDTLRFDISAKIAEGATQDQLPEMFQALLEDRFGLTFHREQREQSVNALVVSKGGLKVKPAALDSAAPAWVSAAASSGTSFRGFIGGIRFRSIRVPNSDGLPMSIMQTPSMGFVRSSRTLAPGYITRFEAPSITFEGLADLAVIAGNGLDTVVDMTGLKGRYQLDLAVSMADLMAGPHDFASMQAAQLSMVQDGLKKLGLQLERRRGSVEVIVIDRLQKTPTEN